MIYVKTFDAFRSHLHMMKIIKTPLMSRKEKSQESVKSWLRNFSARRMSYQ